LIYDFSNDLRPLRVNYSSSFWPNHLTLEREKLVDHPLAKCPDMLHPPPLRVYEDGVWSDVAVPSVYSK
jgi:hypothetical protein